MRYRRCLYLVLVGLVILAGCSATVSDPYLHIENESLSDATLHINIVREGPPEERAVVYNDTITVAANDSWEREVFGAADGYDLTVTLDNQTLTFGTHPTCANATTTLSIRPSGRLEGFGSSCGDYPSTPVVAKTQDDS